MFKVYFIVLETWRYPTEKCKGISVRKIDYNSVARQTVNRHIQQKIFPPYVLRYHALLQFFSHSTLRYSAATVTLDHNYSIIVSTFSSSLNKSGQTTLYVCYSSNLTNSRNWHSYAASRSILIAQVPEIQRVNTPLQQSLVSFFFFSFPPSHKRCIDFNSTFKFQC